MPDPETMNVAPTFDYQEHTEIIKRFVEKLTRLTSEPFPTDDAFMDFVDFIRKALPHVRPAVSKLLADDVLVQIDHRTFPARNSLDVHAFTPYEEPDQGVCSECGLFIGAKAHLFA